MIWKIFQTPIPSVVSSIWYQHALQGISSSNHFCILKICSFCEWKFILFASSWVSFPSVSCELGWLPNIWLNNILLRMSSWLIRMSVPLMWCILRQLEGHSPSGLNSQESEGRGKSLEEGAIVGLLRAWKQKQIGGDVPALVYLGASSNQRTGMHMQWPSFNFAN